MPSPEELRRLQTACASAVDRLRGGGDPFAPLGETLFWLITLAEASRDSTLPVIQGLKWARNRITHGALVTAPIETVPGAEPGRLVLGRSRLGTVTTHLWLPRSKVSLASTARTQPAQDRAYDAEVAGQPLLEPIDRALRQVGTRD